MLDIEITDRNYNKTMQQHRKILLVGTHKLCLSCCIHEQVFYSLSEHFLKKQEILLGRVELGTNQLFSRYFSKVKRFPAIVYIVDTVPYVFQGILDEEAIARFILRVDQPLKVIKSFQKLDAYLQETRLHKQTNVIGCFYDSRELAYEVEQFQKAAVTLLERQDVYFILLEGKKEIKKAKEKYGSSWFEAYSYSSVVIQKDVHYFEFIDISTVVMNFQSLEQQILQQATNLVDEFTLQNYQCYQDKKLPILVVVLDTILEIEKSKQFLVLMEEIAL